MAAARKQLRTSETGSVQISLSRSQSVISGSGESNLPETEAERDEREERENEARMIMAIPEDIDAPDIKRRIAREQRDLLAQQRYAHALILRCSLQMGITQYKDAADTLKDLLEAGTKWEYEKIHGKQTSTPLSRPGNISPSLSRETSTPLSRPGNISPSLSRAGSINMNIKGAANLSNLSSSISSSSAVSRAGSRAGTPVGGAVGTNGSNTGSKPNSRSVSRAGTPGQGQTRSRPVSANNANNAISENLPPSLSQRDPLLKAPPKGLRLYDLMFIKGRCRCVRSKYKFKSKFEIEIEGSISLYWCCLVSCGVVY